MFIRKTIVSGILALISWNSAFGQTPAARGESHKYRTILTIAGAAGGFVVGIFAGMSAFDDAINSERKVTLTAAASAAGGGVGGYFLGRALDRRRQGSTTTTHGRAPDAGRAFVPDQARRSFDDFYRTLRLRHVPAIAGGPDPCPFHRRMELPALTSGSPDSGENARSAEFPATRCAAAE